MSETEADTCRLQVVPALQSAGWDTEPHSIAEQRTITDGRIVPAGKGFLRKPPKRVDFLLRFRRDFALAVVEAKASYRSATDAIHQAREYAEMLGLKFAYATNGDEIVEIDYFTGRSARAPRFRPRTSSGRAIALEQAFTRIGSQTVCWNRSIKASETKSATTSRSPSTAS